MKQQSISYEQAIAELEQLLEDLEAQAIPVESMVAKSKRANELIAFCKNTLRAIEAEIQPQQDGLL